ncbi:MAG: HDOD domain-containing protein [Capsulimonadaceae bacterium]|nr:HDOD domain-containing protein [Capsulimonadaceae bacterium]
MNAKPRILFVDDEPNVLQALQRMLRPQRGEWDMLYASGSVEALQLLNDTPFDIIITDMRMPIMNGAELLGEVRARSPQTVRMALSGHTDREFIFRAVSSTHQFLSKPCNSEVLKDTIARCVAARDLIDDIEIRAFVGRITSVPSIRDTFDAFSQSLEQGDAKISRIGKIVASDIALSAKCLQLVNSAFFGTPRLVLTPQNAALLMGTEALRETFRQPDVGSTFPSEQMANFDPLQVLKHSCLASRIALRIAQAEKLDPQIGESAALAAFLHDIGKLLMAAEWPERYDAFQGCPASQRRRMEQTEFGATHGKIGGYLLSLWGFGTEIVEAVAWHHAPSQSSYGQSTVLAIAHAANLLASEKDASTTCDEWDMQYLALAGYGERTDVWRALAACETECEDLPQR